MSFCQHFVELFLPAYVFLDTFTTVFVGGLLKVDEARTRVYEPHWLILYGDCSIIDVLMSLFVVLLCERALLHSRCPPTQSTAVRLPKEKAKCRQAMRAVFYSKESQTGVVFSLAFKLTYTALSVCALDGTVILLYYRTARFEQAHLPIDHSF